MDGSVEWLQACLYCESVAGDLPQAVIYQDETVVAFLDWRQRAPGHVLIVPRRHLSAAQLFADPAGQRVLAAALRVAAAVRALGADGVQMGAILFPGSGAARVSGRLHPDEPAAVETAEDSHFHLHVLPRTHAEERARIYPYGDDVASPEEIQSLAARLRLALRSGN